MKRKRFVKLAMSYGVQRNEAERLAKLVCVLGSTENKPVYLDFEQVAAIVRVLSDEDGEEAAETEE